MSIILADTSGLYSLLSRRGQHHTEALEFYSTLPRQTEVIVIEYILLETMTLLRAEAISASCEAPCTQGLMSLSAVPGSPSEARICRAVTSSSFGTSR